MDEVTADVYSQGLRDAQQVQHKELSGALREMQKAEQRYYNAKGWRRGFFGAFSMLSHALFQYFQYVRCLSEVLELRREVREGLRQVQHGQAASQRY